MSLKRIRLELARNPDFPEGSKLHGYEFLAPLLTNGHLNVDAWRSGNLRKTCTVRRFWNGEDDQLGELVHVRGRDWAFSYAPGDADDEVLAKLDRHVIKEGEYLTIREPDDRTYTFRVVSIDG
jgi:hypothetical protein